MGFFDMFKRRNNNDTTAFQEEIIQPSEEIKAEIEDREEGEMQIEVAGTIQEENCYSNTISNETIEKIKTINHIEYIGDIMIQRMEKYPELVSLLLEGNVSEDTLFLLNYDEMIYLPSKEEDLKFLPFLDCDEKNQKLVELLNNRVNMETMNDEYIKSYMDLSQEFQTVDFNRKVKSFIPDIELDLGSEMLTETAVFSSFVVYFPKSKYKCVHHDFKQFISGNIELDEDIVIQMSYDTFRYLDEAIIDKISKCKIVFSESMLEYQNEENVQVEDDENYKLIKYNHLIYMIENSSLDADIKGKLIYQLKNTFVDDGMYFDLGLPDEVLSYLSLLDTQEIKKITEEFELNIDIYKTKSIEKPEFHASYYLDEVLPNFDNASLQDVIHFINQVPEEFKQSVLREPRVLKKLDLPSNLDEEALQKITFLLSQKLTSTTTEFVHSLDFDVERFMMNKDNDFQTSLDINPIVSNYGVFDSVDEKVDISVADLLGHDSIRGYNGRNILHTFEKFFDKDGDGYHTRALDLLKYQSGEELLNEFEKRNHDTLDMKVRQVENGKYVVSGNGLHRFTVLRFHYLLDRFKNEKSEEELRELYKIPVNLVSVTNFHKTYCNYLLQKTDSDISYISFDSKQDKTTIFHKSGMESETISEEELQFLVTQSVDMLDSASLIEIVHFYNHLPSFREFVDTYIPHLVTKIEMENTEVVHK